MAAILAVIKHLRKFYIGLAADVTTRTTAENGSWLLATDSSNWYVAKNGAWIGPITGGPSGSV